jgi:hypothetical protein
MAVREKMKTAITASAWLYFNRLVRKKEPAK